MVIIQYFMQSLCIRTAVRSQPEILQTAPPISQVHGQHPPGADRG